jgi:hypothetical protein
MTVMFSITIPLPAGAVGAHSFEMDGIDLRRVFYGETRTSGAADIAMAGQQGYPRGEVLNCVGVLGINQM